MSERGLFSHLDRLSDERGLFEHALGRTRQEVHGYCTDDNARMAVVCLREADDQTADRLRDVALEFVLASLEPDGRCRNRMDRDGRWTDHGATGDWWGRALWALGTAVGSHPDPVMKDRCLAAFELATRQRSAWPRSMAFATLGAGEVFTAHPDRRPARQILTDTVNAIGPAPQGGWQWPERRLSYANATLAEALIVAGNHLTQPRTVERGAGILAWLLVNETRDGHLSVTGTGGRGPNDLEAQFDQQPIEVAAMADACWRACVVTGDQAWTRGIAAAAGWFNGDNDAGLAMHDPVSGGAYDGLSHHSVNANQGAESTIAYISTMQRARSFAATT